jgi:hypothetical protein
MCSEPGINGGLDSTSRAIVRDWLKVGEVDSAVNYFCTACADIFFGDAALPDAVTFLVAEGASIGALASLEEGVGALAELGRSGDRRRRGRTLPR